MASDRIIVVEETGDGLWRPSLRFAEAKDARTWLARGATPGLYHILSFRDEDVAVQPAPPAPIGNVVAVGRQHLERMVRVLRHRFLLRRQQLFCRRK